MTTTEKAFELAKLNHDAEFWKRELEKCPPHEALLRSYIIASLNAVTEDLEELVDA